MKSDTSLNQVSAKTEVSNSLSSAHANTEEIATIGSWKANLVSQEFTLSNMAFEILELALEQRINIQSIIECFAPQHRNLISDKINLSIHHGKKWCVEAIIVTTTGKPKWVQTHCRPVVENGETIGLEGTIQDIHVRKTLEIERDSMLERMERTEHLASIGHWDWSLEPERIVWSKGLYDIWELPVGSAVPSIEEHGNWIHPEDKALFFNTLSSSIKTESDYSFVFRGIFGTTTKYIKADGTPNYDDNGKLTGFFGTATDVTNQLLTEAGLRRANEELSQFAYRTSHDLKGPLASIKGLSQIIKLDIDNQNLLEASDNALKIYQQASKLDKLVVDILDLAKAELKDEKREEVHIKTVAEEVKERCKNLALVNNVCVEVDVNESIAWHVQRVRLTQVIENLLVNAIKYCNPKQDHKFARISACDKTLIVADNGLGIKQEDIETLFSMFSRFHPTICDGSGLGMNIVKKHVDAMRAHIEVESSEKGSQFSIQFPLEVLHD